MKKYLRLAASGLGLMVAVLLVAEVAVRLFTPYPIHGKKPLKVYDPDFGYRMNPDHPEMNGEGFRAMRRTDGEKIVAAVGDGLTYGGSFEPWFSWPARFEELSGVPTSNYGIGSYGIYSYYAVSRYALDRGHRYVIVALQAQNDFAFTSSSCAIDYDRSPIWRDVRSRHALSLPECGWRDTWNKSAAPELLRAMYGRLRIALRQAVRCGFPRPVSDDRKCIQPDLKPEPWPHPAVREPDVVLAAASLPFSKKAASRYFNESSLRIAREDVASSDLAERRTARAVADAEKLLSDLQEKARGAGAKVGVLLIPPKTQLVYEYADDRDSYEQHDWLLRMALNQQAMERLLADYLTLQGIAWSTARPELLAALLASDSGGPPVFGKGGSHPRSAGYEAYARAALRLYMDMEKL